MRGIDEKYFVFISSLKIYASNGQLMHVMSQYLPRYLVQTLAILWLRPSPPKYTIDIDRTPHGLSDFFLMIKQIIVK